MLEAKDLRQGNYVYFNGKNKKIGSVYFIFDKTVALNQRHDVFYDLKYLEPIPLTEEILLRLGFEKELDNFYRKNKICMIEILFHDNGIIVSSQSVCLSSVKYLHDIQNLYYSLYKQELTLKP